MSMVLTWVCLIGLSLALCYWAARPVVWVLAFGVVYFVGYALGWVPRVFVIGMLLVFFMLLILTGIRPLRQRLITKLVLQWFLRRQPKLSSHEQHVLEAGGTWWEAPFFTGQPDWSHLQSLSSYALTEAEQAFLANQTETLCAMCDDWAIVNELHDLPEAVWAYIKKEKFWGLCIPQADGGLGFSANAHSAIVSKIASRSVSVAFTVMVPNSLGPAEFIHLFGTPEQKAHYLPQLAKGEQIPCFALTGPEAGSDATSILDVGEICEGDFEGKKVIGIRLQFDKRYITLAPVATLIGLAFKCYDPNRLLGGDTALGITVALVPAHLPGIEIGARHAPLNLAFMNGPIRGRDVFIPLDYVIGGPSQIGQGWQMMLACLSVGRGISLPALAAAAGKLCFKMSADYAVIRRQFQRPIGDFEGIQAALGRIGGLTFLMEAVRRFTAQGVTEGAKPSTASAIAKYHLTELCRRVIADAMDIHGGRAVQMGPNNYLAYLYHGIPIMATVEGANILTRSLIIFGQGVMRSHPFLKDEIEAANAPVFSDALKQFDRYVFQHIGFTLQNFARTLVSGFFSGRQLQVPYPDEMARGVQQLTRMSSAFMLLTDVTLLCLGSRLKIRESISARLGDMLSHLYMGAAVIKYFTDLGMPQDMLPFWRWAMQKCLHRIQIAIVDLTQNFPIRWLGRLLRWIIFPGGLAYGLPSDADTRTLALTMQQNTRVRDVLTQGCFVGMGMEDPTGRMELTFHALWQAAPLFAKVEQAISRDALTPNDDWQVLLAQAKDAGILSEGEWAQLQAVESMRHQVIAVDEFNEE